MAESISTDLGVGKGGDISYLKTESAIFNPKAESTFYLKTGSPIFDLIAESVSTDFGESGREGVKFLTLKQGQLFLTLRQSLCLVTLL